MNIKQNIPSILDLRKIFQTLKQNKEFSRNYWRAKEDNLSLLFQYLPYKIER